MIAVKTRVTVGEYPCDGTVVCCEAGFVTVLMDDGMELRVRSEECMEALTSSEREQLLNVKVKRKKGDRTKVGPVAGNAPCAGRSPAGHRSRSLEVDLHLEALQQAHLFTPGDIPLQAQLDRFDSVMRAHASHKGMKIYFIHGVGQQTLKTALQSALRTRYPSCGCEEAPYHLYGVGGALLITIL